MRNTITIRRWRIDLYDQAIYIQKQPKPKCADCRGAGHVEIGGPVDHPDAEYEPCPCWDPFRSLRIPLWLRAQVTERYPF